MVAGEDAIRQFLLFSTTEGDIWRSPFFFSPTLLLLYIATICLYSSYRAPYQPDNTPNTQSRNSKLLFKLVFFFSCLISLTLLADIMVVIVRLMKEKVLTLVLGYYSSMSFLIWISNTYYLMKKANKFSMWQTLQSSFYGLAIIGETMIGWLWLMAMMQSGQSSVLSIYDKCLLSTFIIRYALEITITIFSVIRKFTNRRRDEEGQSETSHLISSSTRTETYGSTIITTTTVYSSDNSISTKLLTTLPFIWPDDNFELQARLIICIFLMLAGVAINVLTPIQVGYVVDHLDGGSGKFAWAAVLAYAGLRYFQGGAGVLKTIQNQTWEPVEKHLLTEISTELKDYLKGLSPEERAYMKMDEAQKTIFKGAKCIIQLLSQVSFHIFPLLATMVVSIAVLGAGYTFLGGLIVFITMAVYTYLTIVITEKQNAKNGPGKSSAALGLAQNSVISTGVLVGSLWYAWQISRNNLTAGDFVVFNMYILQLGTPLRFLGNYYQMTQKSFKDLGDMSMLFTNKETSTDIQEVDGPPSADSDDAHIVFDRVQFGYDGERDIFKNLSFTVKKDAFVAVVGPSKCGKSTLMRLIFRFYDPLSGKIYVNGQDSKNIEHSILRQNIGFIPQSTILFNDTVLYNIRHGNIDASDEDVFYAAQVAQVHNQILKFPQGYSTRLGERGYKISNSVKQRIAIARAILKNPNLLLLDESTSALGAKREKSIQKALADFSDNCTVFFATRRLSSIVDADVILVMKDGHLVEYGTHEELIERSSRNNTSSLYSSMWQKQIESSNSSCQDSKSNNPVRIIGDDNSEEEQPISHNTETGESSISNNKHEYSSRTSALPSSVKLSNSEISECCTASFPTFTGSSITTYTDVNVSKTSQFSISMPVNNNLSTLFSKYDFSDYTYKNHPNITDTMHSPLRPTKPLLLEPSSSLSSSHPGELIIPKLSDSDLNQFDKLITLESGIYKPPITTTTANQTIHTNSNTDNSSYSTDTSSNGSSPTNLYTGNTSKLILNDHYGSITSDIYNHTQFTMPATVKPKASRTTSNAGEFILPIFSESILRNFSKSSAGKPKTDLISEETTYADTPSSQLPEASTANSTQYLSPKESDGNINNIIRPDFYSNLQDAPTNIQLAKSELTVPVSNEILSKNREIIIPEFSDSTFRRLDKVTINKSVDSSLSNNHNATSIKTDNVLSVQAPYWQKHTNKDEANSNIHGDIYGTIQLVTPEFKEPISSLISSRSAELIVPKFSDSKLKQFRKPIANKSYVVNSRVNDTEVAVKSQKYIHDGLIGEPNALQSSCDFIQLTVPSLAKSKKSTICSNPAELFVPLLSNSKLKRFSGTNFGEFLSTSQNTGYSSAKNDIETSGETSTCGQYTYSTSTLGRNCTHISCDSIQLSMSCLAKSQQSVINSNTAELIVPRFSKSTSIRFRKCDINKSSVASTSREVTGTRITDSKMHSSSVNDIQQTVSVKHLDQMNTTYKYDTHIADPTIMQNTIQISKQEIKTSEQYQNLLNPAELIIPVFSMSYLKRFSKVGMTEGDVSSSSTLLKTNISRNGEIIPVNTEVGEGSNNSRSDAYAFVPQVTTIHFRLSTPELKKPTTVFASSNNGELVIPPFSRSFLTKISKLKTTKLSADSISEVNENECNTPTLPEVHDSEHITTVSNSREKGKSIASTERLLTESIIINGPSKVIMHSNGQDDKIKEAGRLKTQKDIKSDAKRNTSAHGEERHSIRTKTTMLGNYSKNDLNSSNDITSTLSSRAKTNIKSPFHCKKDQLLKSDTAKSVKSELSQTLVSKATTVDLNKTATVDKAENMKTPDQNLAKVGVNIGHSISTEYKEPNKSNRGVNQVHKLTDKKKRIHAESKSISSDNDNPRNLRTILSNEEEPKIDQNNYLKIPRVTEPVGHETINIYERKDILSPKSEISHYTSSLDSAVSADSKEQNANESKIEHCHESGTPASTLPSTTTVVQLEISKTAELSIVKFRKAEISNYVKSEQAHPANISPQKDFKLRQRQVFQSDSAETSRTSSIKPNKGDNINNYIIEINKQNEFLEANNGQPLDCSAKTQSNRDALLFQTGNRNWRKRLRRAFPVSVLTNESFVSANARLYLPRSSDHSVLDTDLLSSISHILHLYENDVVNVIKMDLVEPTMPKMLDASTEIQLITSDNANFIIPKYKSLNLSKFKQETHSKSFEIPSENIENVEIPKDNYNYNEQSTSKPALLNTPSYSVEYFPETSNTRDTGQRNCKTRKSNAASDLCDVATSTPTSDTSDIPRIQNFNKAKHIQLYTPLIAKLISFDIAAILSNYIFKISTMESFSAPSVLETSKTDIINTTREITTFTDQNHIKIPGISSSRPINGDTSLGRRCYCKEHREIKHETVEIQLKSEIIEIILESNVDETYRRYQIEYVELELESSDDELDIGRI